MPWNTNEEKLLCFMLIDNRLAETVLGPEVKGLAYWRAFIVQDRKTGKIVAKWRFKYPSGDRNWYTIEPMDGGLSDEQKVDKLRVGLEAVINIASETFNVPYRAESFFPPDDEGDPMKIIAWLQKMDLIEEPKLEEKR